MGCTSEDDSFFCKFARFFQIVMMVIGLLLVVCVIYVVAKGGASALFGGARLSSKYMR